MLPTVLRTKPRALLWLIALVVGTVFLGAKDEEYPDIPKEQLVLIQNVLNSISKAAKARDKEGLLKLMAPPLRQYNSVANGETADSTKSGNCGWRDETQRFVLCNIAESANVEMIHVYHFQKSELWEVFIRNQSDRLSMAGLWYFIKEGDKLLIREAPDFIGPPTFKTFNVEGRPLVDTSKQE
jgi:hypothetical protein